MKQSDWLDLAELICRLWPHAPVEPETAAAWWPFVQDLDPDQARQAIAMCAAEPGRRFPPSVGDILAAARPPADDWWDAWLQVHTAIAGTKGRVRYDGPDPGIAEFVATLGEWREQVDETSPALRAQFRDWWRSRIEQTDRQRRQQIAARAIDSGDPPALGAA